MEQLQETISIPLQNNAAPFRRLPYLRFVFILFWGFALANIGVTIFAQSVPFAQPILNPFLDYMDIFPGQRLSSVDGRTYSCWGDYNYGQPSQVICKFLPSSGVFASVEISLLEGVVRQISFTMRENPLKVGDLILFFGNPNICAYPHNIFFFWSHLFVNVSTTNRGNSAPMRPVWSVTFVNT